MKKTSIKSRIKRASEIIDRNKMFSRFCQDDVKEFAEICQAPITGAMKVYCSQFPNNTRHLSIEIDGAWSEKSWRKLISPITANQKAKKVMRDIVSDEMRDYMASAEPKVCAYCGTIENLTVDHVYPPFTSIASDFIKENGVPKIEKGKDCFGPINRFADMNLEANWIEYHSARAVYQILCGPCNSAKGAR